MKLTKTLATSAIALGLLAFVNTSCKKDGWLNCPRANGKMVTETRMVSDFTEIELEGSGDVYLYQSSAEGSHTVEIEASKNIMDQITTKVKGASSLFQVNASGEKTT